MNNRSDKLTVAAATTRTFRTSFFFFFGGWLSEAESSCLRLTGAEVVDFKVAVVGCGDAVTELDASDRSDVLDEAGSFVRFDKPVRRGDGEDIDGVEGALDSVRRGRGSSSTKPFCLFSLASDLSFLYFLSSSFELRDSADFVGELEIVLDFLAVRGFRSAYVLSSSFSSEPYTLSR